MPQSHSGSTCSIKKSENLKAKNKLQSEWSEGVWLGHTRSSNEVLIGTPEGVVRAYTVERMEEGSRWNSQAIKDMKGTPQQPDPRKPTDRAPIKITFDEPNEDEPSEMVPPRRGVDIRRVRITDELLRQHGYTDDCPGCRHKRVGLQGSRGHNETCRTRMAEAMNDSA